MIRTATIIAALALATPALADPSGLIVCTSPGFIEGSAPVLSARQQGEGHG